MKEAISTVTSKGQVTIPAEIRRLLGVGRGDKVAFIIEGDQVRLTSAIGVVERTAGALKTDQPALSAEELRQAAEQAIAREGAERAQA